MGYSSPTSLVPIPPPGEDELPSDDGEPMETQQHRDQMMLLIESLDLAWRDRPDFYVGGNMFVYFSELQAKSNDFRGPDVFVVLDTVKRKRKSWVVWQEGGRTPNVVIELLSERTENVDRGEKMRIYAKVLRVPEYYLFDPLRTDVLEGYRLDVQSGEYRRMAPAQGGDLPCDSLGLRLGVRKGAYRSYEGDYLRWLTPGGEVLPTAQEETRAAQEEARAAQEEVRAAQEEARCADEKARQLSHQLAQYEKKFGKLD